MNRSRPRTFSSALRHGFEQIAFLVVATLSPLLLFSGCTSPKYRSASKETLPVVLLNIPSTEPPIEALLHATIIYRGPGSWKQDAYWDEYVVTIANRGSALVALHSAWLTDFQDKETEAGTDPWVLETNSRSLAENGFGAAKNTIVQIGGGVGIMAVGSGVGALLFSAYAAGGAAVGGLLLLPAVIGGTIYSNMSNRRTIEREFARRRLVFPLELVPGQLVQGSFFFRISPGPQRLIVKCQVDNEPRDVVIELQPLAGLHLKAPVAGAPITRPLD